MAENAVAPRAVQRSSISPAARLPCFFLTLAISVFLCRDTPTASAAFVPGPRRQALPIIVAPASPLMATPNYTARMTSTTLFGRGGNRVGGGGGGDKSNKKKRVAKSDLPHKVCVICGRPFTWRKKWERSWDEVTTCSKSCNAERRAVGKGEGGG